MRVPEPKAGVDGNDYDGDDDGPLPRPPFPGKQCPQKDQTQDIEGGMMKAQVSDVRREQTPPLSGRNVRAVVPQEVGGGSSAQLR